ncbi:MAG: leucine-rich repeat protein [Kiritimatiellia bacterium]
MSMEAVKLAAVRFMAGAIMAGGFAGTAQAKWTVTATGSWGAITESETGWALTVNAANTSAVSIRNVKTVGTGTVVDLTETDGFTLTAIGGMASTVITECVLPDTVTTIAKYAFQNDSALEKITFGKGLTPIVSSVFMSCPLLKEIHCRGFPFSSDYTQSANLTASQVDLGLSEDHSVRVFFPATDEEWGAFLKSSYVTAWGDLDEATQAKYAFADGTEPVGLSTRTGLKNVWLVAEGGAAADSYALVVAANGAEYGAVTPTYGEEPVEYTADQLPVACVATVSFDRGEKILHTCTGCTLFKFDDGSWREVETKSATAYSFAPAEPGNYKLVWNWELAGYRVPSMSAFDGSTIGCTVTVASESEQLEGGYWPKNAVVTYTASGAAPFVRWFGDLVKADEAANPLTVTMDAERDFAPVFRTTWRVAEDAKTMTDGYWTLNISGTDGYTIGSGPTLLIVPGVLDLAKPTSSGVPAVGFGTQAFKNNADLRELVLPNTLAIIADSAFEGCGNLVRVDPFLPDSVSSLGISAFSFCTNLVGDLVVGGGRTAMDFVYSQWAYQFRECRKISGITFGKQTGDLRKYSFWNCTGFEYLRFYGKPSIVSGAFAGAATYRKVYLPRSNADWMDFCNDATYVTKWSALDEASRKKFTDSYPDESLPFGLSTTAAPFGQQWIFVFGDASGLMVIIR